jgi:hypothetical protein
LLTLATFVIVGLLMQKNLLNIFWYLAAYNTIGCSCGLILGFFLPNMGEGSLLIYYPFELAVLIEFFLLNTGFSIKNKILQQQVIKAQQEIIKRCENKKIVD